MSAIAAGPAAGATLFSQTNLVSDLPGVAAHQDTDLVNPWGIDFGPGGPIWISDNGTEKSTIYTGNGTKVAVGGFPSIGVPGNPTGVVFNNTAGFQVEPGKKAAFIFGSEDGSISAWNPLNPSATTKVLPSSAVYKGVTIGTVPLGGLGQIPLLYAANFNSGKVDVFGSDFSKIGSFTDNTAPAGYAPFNVQNIGGQLYVTFAQQDVAGAGHDDVAGPGHGFIDIFNLDGTLAKRFASNGPLDSPWGLAMAPAGFGDVGGDLLVGNFGDGTINVFDPSSGTFKGKLLGKDGNPITIEGLWGLKFGDGAPLTKNGPADTLFFTAGIPGTGELEDHGLFGSIRVVPEPGTYALLGGGLAFLLMLRKRISNPV
jgi:uncharacterized protein (TIGR03118 family)